MYAESPNFPYDFPMKTIHLAADGHFVFKTYSCLFQGCGDL